MNLFWPAPEIITTGLAVAILWCAFFASGKFRLRQLVRYYALQSLFLAGLLLSLAIYYDQALFVSALLTLFVKVGLLPALILSSAKRSYASGRLTSIIGPTSAYFVSGIVLFLAVFFGMVISSALADTDLMLVTIAMAVIFLGGAMLVARQDIYSEIIGLLTLGNGVALLAAATLGAIQIIFELGIMAVLVGGVIVMSLLARRFKEMYALEDLRELNEPSQ